MGEQDLWGFDDNTPDAYERHLVPALFTPWADELVGRAALQLGERVVDVACGTGIVARLAATQVGANGHVVGIDLNRGMLEVAGRQSKSSSGKVEWREGDVSALPCEDSSFDVAFCQQGLQFFPERSAALGEIHRALAPGGRFALSIWRQLSHSPYVRAIADALEEHVGPEVATGWRSVCGFGDAEAVRNLLLEAGFEDVHFSIVIITMRHPSLATFIPGQLAATPIGDTISALDASVQSALLEDIVSALQPYTDDDGLAVPTTSNVFMARKS